MADNRFVNGLGDQMSIVVEQTIAMDCWGILEFGWPKNWMPAKGRRGRGRGECNDDEYTTGSDSDGSSSGGGPSDYTKKVGMFCFCVAAIYAAYITQGVLQENM